MNIYNVVHLDEAPCSLLDDTDASIEPASSTFRHVPV